MGRTVEPELLDDLAPDDARAIGSRTDLRRLNFIMGHAAHLSRALRRHFDETLPRSKPLHLVDLGAGDGTLLLRLARRWAVRGVTAEVTLVDRHPLLSAESRRSFAALDWSVKSAATDVFDWLEQPSSFADVMFANLFLHHFPEKKLAALLRRVAARTNLFIACEPRRSTCALFASRLLGFIGCNAVTRHDAVVSVRAGFAGRELSVLWPAQAGWELSEESACLFSHCFIAKRNA